MKKSVAVKNDQIPMFVLAIALALVALWALGCGGGGSSSGGSPMAPSGNTGGTGSNIGATITLTSNGVSDATPRVNTGQRVQFINNDTRPHEMLSTPHGAHNDCPPLNRVGMLQPGQSGTSDALTSQGGCGFHDHMNPDNSRFRGQVLVGLAASDPTPPEPGY
jgi:hypothetical protein